MPPIIFIDEDFQNIDPKQDDPMVITVEITEHVVLKTMVDQGSSIDILFWETFQKLNLREEDMTPYWEQIIEFSCERVYTRWYIDLKTMFGMGNVTKTNKNRYLVVEACTLYNALLERFSLNNKLAAIVSTPHLAMEFPTERGKIATIYVDERVARECYMESLKMVQEPIILRRREDRRNLVAMVDLDLRMHDEEKMESREEPTLIQLG